MTNGDRIRSMTDDELADFLQSYESRVCCHCKYDDAIGCNFGNDDIICTSYYVHGVFLEWLSKEADLRLEKENSLLPIR